jgi:hypothetical protein
MQVFGTVYKENSRMTDDYLLPVYYSLVQTMAAQEADSHEGHSECEGGKNLHWCHHFIMHLYIILIFNIFYF